MRLSRVKKIVIVGGGTAGWMAAAAFSRVIGCRIHDIVLVESKQIGTVGVGEATIPMISLFNKKVLGIDENEFVRETNGTFKLGIEFVNWRRQGHAYFHPFGGYGIDMDGVSFTHFWRRWIDAGGGLDYTRFSPEIEAARAARFMRTEGEPGSKLMPDINYAFQFDANLYAAYLRRYAERLGVNRIEGKVIGVDQDPDSGNIQCLRLDAGDKIDGDFFLDCSGFRALLIEGVFKAGYHDWSKWLPVNTAMAVPCASAGELLPYTRATALDAGWQWRIPLQHRTGNGYVFSNQFISEDEAANSLLKNIDGRILAEPRPLHFVTGVRKKSWIKNCVALGLANGFLEPLESTSIHLVQVAISKILTMFPRTGFNEWLIERYNDEMFREYDIIKNFLIAHYKVTEREDTPFWQYVKNMEIPLELSERLQLFRERGEVIAYTGELFKETSWFAVLMGQGLIPEAYHPVADSISDDELRLRLTKIRAGVKARVESMPSHADYIRHQCAANIRI